MKKIVVLILLGMFLFMGNVLAVLNTLEAGKTTVPIEQSWDLSSNEIKSIFLDGTQQDLNITIETTDNPVSQVSISGKIPKESADVLKTAKVSLNRLYLPFAKKGFRLAVTPSGRDTLNVTIKLAKSARFDEVRIETWTGDINLTVPEKFSGKFDLNAHGGKVSQNVSEKGNSDEIIVIETYGNINVKKSK